ncbi:LUD domain-containing protein [Halorubellus salinus]|uniref:LUD domain-containing protein n=1 Tax=Halorubellus salinus TaxID=755309 RepID=UPI001D07DD32|nr:LUD domain-containing protein [Halorubellus salinus]
MTDPAIDHVDAFRASLEAAGVTHETVALGEATAAIERAVEEPTVGVPVHVDASLPASVDTEFSPSDLHAATTGVTPARLGVAALGSLLVPSGEHGDELVALYPERHVAVLAASDVVPDLDAATDWLQSEVDAGRDSYVFATGVSATADMGALVEGVHGPTNVHVVLVDDREATSGDDTTNA